MPHGERKAKYYENPLPSSEESERCILGAILLDNNLAAQATTRLRPDDFYSPMHRKVFSAIVALYETGQEINPIFIGEELKKEGGSEFIGGVAAITNLTWGIPHFSSIREYVGLVKESAMRRTAMRRLAGLTDVLADKAVPIKDFCVSLSSLESEMRETLPEETDSFRKIADVFETDVLPTLTAYYRQEASSFLIPTGFPEIDEVLNGGLYLSDMLAVVAPPKSAKSAFALQLALKIAEQGHSVALLSLEMSNLQNGLRFIAQKSYTEAMKNNDSLNEAISASWLKPGLYKSTYEKASAVAALLFDANLYLCQKPLEWREVQAETRRLVREKDLRVLIVDYWQLVNHRRTQGQSRTENLAEIAKGLKQLGQELNICVVALGQFNQEGLKQHRDGKELSVLYLEGSGELVKSANIVLTLDIKPADLNVGDAPRTGTMTFRPLRSAADAKLDCLFFGKYLTVEITRGLN